MLRVSMFLVSLFIRISAHVRCRRSEFRRDSSNGAIGRRRNGASTTTLDERIFSKRIFGARDAAGLKFGEVNGERGPHKENHAAG